MTYAEHHYLAVSEWEFAEAVKRANDARRLPRGHGRLAAMSSIAADYGVSSRTLYRYAKGTLRSVKVGRHSALFMLRKGRAPTQVTAWAEESPEEAA